MKRFLTNLTNKNLFFVSDFHFNHGNVMKYCRRPGLTEQEQEYLNAGVEFKVGRESVERMDSYLIDETNKIVGEEDILWFLGDFCFASKHNYFEIAKSYRNRINCKNIFCLWGNHDRQEIASLFSAAQDYAEINWQGQIITMFHYALATWNKSHHSSWNLYAHSHGTAESWFDKMMPNRRSIDVGVDNAARILGAYRPFSFEEVRNIMKNRSGHSIDHHS